MSRTLRGLVLGLGLITAAAARGQEEPPQAALVFRWEQLPGAVAYFIEIAEDKAFTKVVLQERVEESFYRWTTPGSGTYFWRVRGIDATGQEGKFSEPRFVGTMAHSPRLLEPAEGASVTPQEKGVKLSWQRSEYLGSYLVEVSPDRAFSSPTRLEAKSHETWFRPPPGGGTFWWRVGGVDLNGDAVPAGEARSFVVNAASASPTPVGTPSPLGTPGPLSAGHHGPGKLLAGAGIGLFGDWQGDPGPHGFLEAGWALSERLSVMAEAGLYSTTPRLPNSPFPGNISSRVYGFPLELLVRLRGQPFSGFTPYGGAGVETDPRYAQVATLPQPSTRLAWEPGVALEGGIARPLGAGQAFLELAAVITPEARAFVDLRGGGITASAGFRIAVW